jgi:hypothetical protein
MNHLLSKKQANNAKCWSIKGKSTKSSVTFLNNIPNLKNIKIGVSPFKTSKCEILTAWRSKKQSQFKANSNPIHQKPKMNLNIYNNKDLRNFSARRGTKTNPNQTQSKPNGIALNFRSTFILQKDAARCIIYR